MSQNADDSKIALTALDATEVSAQRIVVQDFVCSAFIGVTEEERAQPQRLAICAELDLVARPPVSDDIDEVLSYGRVVGLLRKISARPDFRLLETLAETLAAAFFSFPQVTATKLRIEKLERYADVAAVGIEIERHRRLQ
ncbi:MAG TPA: dihydroneopterin aldolase [Kiloniellaceae bacterium]|nr:dihydroneopterin aldolase [Kiloniellaceae bacterium]